MSKAEVFFIFGLTFIRGLTNKSMQEIADRLSISKQAINQWESCKRPIPKKRLEQLQEIFEGIPKDYFGKYITENEKNEIEYIKLKQDYNKLEKSLEAESDEQGNKIICINSDQDLQKASELEMISLKMNRLNTIQKINNLLEFNELRVVDSGITYAETIVEIYDSLSEIVKNKITSYYDLSILSDILFILKIYYGIEVEKQHKQEEDEPEHFNELYSLNEKFKEGLQKLVKQEEERIKEVLKSKEEFYNK